MSARKDVLDLLRQAERLGAVVTRRPSGHWHVSVGRQHVAVAYSPSRQGAVHQVRRDLRRRLGLDL